MLDKLDLEGLQIWVREFLEAAAQQYIHLLSDVRTLVSKQLLELRLTVFEAFSSVLHCEYVCQGLGLAKYYLH